METKEEAKDMDIGYLDLDRIEQSCNEKEKYSVTQEQISLI